MHRPVDHELYHAAIAALTEIRCGLRPLLKEKGIERPLESLADLEVQLEKATGRFEAEVGKEKIRQVMDESAVEAFGRWVTKENESFERYLEITRKLIAKRFDAMPVIDDSFIRERYEAGDTPHEIIS